MKVVIDTNVLVSAVLKDRGPERVVRFVVGHPDFEWIVSREILEEYREVLGRRRFGLPEALLRTWCTLIDAMTTVVAVPTRVKFERDRADAKFLACALAVTGDRNFEGAQRLLATEIVSVSLFEKHVCGTWG